MANTHHTGIPKLQWSFNYPPCTPSVTIVADKNPFCLGDSVTFTPTFACVDDVTITAYGWVVNGSIQSTSAEPFVTNTLTNGNSVYMFFITSTGQTYFSNVITMQEKTEGCITEIKYGLLYNWFAATDERNITSAGDFIVPSIDDFITLLQYYGAVEYEMPTSEMMVWLINNENVLKFMSSGLFWDSNDGTNETGLTFTGAGGRLIGGEGMDEFMGLGFITSFVTTDLLPTDAYRFIICSVLGEDKQLVAHISEGVIPTDYAFVQSGQSIRLVRPATASELLLLDGTACDNYVGNDGKIYPTVKIGTQVWTAANLAETKFRNGDYIHGYEGGSYQAISNAAWANLTDSALCAYNDDLNNV